jgi:hypothetical protein
VGDINVQESYSLQFAIQTPDRGVICKITFNRLTRNDLKAAHQAANGDRVREEEILIAQMTGLPIEALDDLDAADNTVLMDRLEELTSAVSTDPADLGQPYALRFPFATPGGAKVEQASASRLRRADFKAATRFAPHDALRQEDFLLAKMTGLNPDDIGRLDAVDNAEVMRRFRYVLGRSGYLEGGGPAAAAGAADSTERDQSAELGGLLDVGGDGAGGGEGAGETP